VDHSTARYRPRDYEAESFPTRLNGSPGGLTKSRSGRSIGQGQIPHAQPPRVFRRIPPLPPIQRPWRTVGPAALRQEFGLAQRLERQPARDPCRQQDKRLRALGGWDPIAPLLHHRRRLFGQRRAPPRAGTPQAFLGLEKLPDPTRLGESLRDTGQPDWQALRRFSRHFVPWALARTEPGRSPHPGRTEVSSSIRRSKSAGHRWKGPRSSTRASGRRLGNGCRSGRFGPIPSGAPLAKPRKLPAGMGPVRT
jgi:hypothetical protein